MIIAGIRKKLILYTIIAAVVVEVISLPVIGPNLLFSYGLAIGACAAIIALNIIAVSIDRAAERGKRKPVIFGYIVRVLLYGGALFLSVRTSGLSFAGAAIGLLLPHAAIYVMYGLVPSVRKRFSKDPPEVWVADNRSLLFVSEPHLILQSNGKTYLTHRHYRKIRVTSDGT